MEQKVKILEIEKLTHDVKRLRVERPKGYEYESGDHTILAINKEGWEKKKRPFSLASSPEEDFLEFIIKIYLDKEGFTDQLDKLEMGDELIIGKAFGKIRYKSPGVFIAAGSGITPFFSLFKGMEKADFENSFLIYANKKKDDIILKEDLKDKFGNNLLFVLSREESEGFEHGRIDKNFLENHIEDFSQYFYICGPFPMVKALKEDLVGLGADKDKIISEV